MSAPEAAQVHRLAVTDRALRVCRSLRNFALFLQANNSAAQDAAADEVSQASPADAPLPMPYVVENEAKRPLPGVQSVFLTGDDDMISLSLLAWQDLMLCCAQAQHLGWLGQQKLWLGRPGLQCL